MDPRSTLRRALIAGVVLGAAVALVVVSRSDDSSVEAGGVDTAAAAPNGPQANTRAHDRGGAGKAAPETIPLPVGLQPEGITSGPGPTFYVGSLADGRVVRGDLRTAQSSVLVPGAEGRVAVGMQFEQRQERLWVAGGPTGTVTAYDAGTGEELGRWTVPGSVFLNDVTVTHDAAYVTDSGLQRLVVVPLGRGGALPAADGVTTLPLTGDLSVVAGEFNANGIRALGRSTLVLIQSNTGTLFLVDAETGSTVAVAVTEGELTGGDGLELARGRLFVVRGGGDDTVAVVKLHRGGHSAEVEQMVTDEDFDVPTTATFARGRLWAVNARFGADHTPTTEYAVVRVSLD